jgi:thymidylate synthase (FAD)
MKQILGANPSYPNDKLKYLLPENWFVKDLMMTINIRSLFNFLFLRTSKTAHFEIRQLAEYMLELLPGDIKELYILYKEQEYKKFK